MDEESIVDEVSDDLLYDILVYHEWPQSQDHRSLSIDTTAQLLPNAKSSWFSYLTSWSAAAKVTGLIDPPQEVLKLLQASPTWKFRLSPDGSLLAVLQEFQLEFYSSKDNFSSSLAKVKLQRDSHPYLRVIEWSPDSSLLVVTTSAGAVDLYDAYGFLVYSVFSQRLPHNEAANEELGGEKSKGYAYAGAFFTDYRVKSRDWLYELILIDYRGSVNSFLLSPSGYQEFSSHKLSNHYPYGVTAVTFSTKHNLLCVAGPFSNKSSGDIGPSSYGLTVWRLLGEPPHYEIVLPYDYIEPKSRWFYAKAPEQDHIFRLEESPEGSHLCALHISGNVSVWHMPGLKLAKLWHLEEQACHDDMNPALMQNPRLKKRKRQFLKHDIKWHPLDVKWWSNDSLVLGRYSGGVSIITMKNIDKNLLGESAEFFAGPCHLSNCFGKGFFVLEREITSRKQKPRMDESIETLVNNQEEEESSEEDDEEVSLVIKGKRLATSWAYTITESERFAPPRKKPKLSYHNYKLLALLSTTPEELYNRKIEMEEYGEALILAQHYNLDSDHVYERQWKLSNLSTTAISDYLGKIKRRSLVLRECLNTVPNEIEALRSLLQYGLQETDLHVLEMMESEAAEGRYIKQKANTGPSEYYLTEEEEMERKTAEEQRLLSKISWDDLSVSQRELLATRYQLLKYLDRLECYIEILDYEDNFDVKFYMKFRDQPLIEAAVEFAHDGKGRAVSTLLERYPKELEAYKLCILSNFPESLSPDEYSYLIPTAEELLRPNDLSQLEPSDWIQYGFVEEKIPAHVIQQGKEQNKYQLTKHEVLTREELTSWVHARARNIEAESSLVDHSLALLQYASDYCGLNINPRLHHQLTTLEVMLYDMQSPLSLSSLESMSDLEILNKLMEKAEKSNLLSYTRKYLVPYLDRLEELENGTRCNLLKNYLLHTSTSSLILPFELIKQVQNHSLFMSFDECVNIGLDCIYAHEDVDEDESEVIVELAHFLKKKCRNKHVMEEIEDILDIMRAIKLLKRYNINKTLHYFKACRADSKAMEDLFVQVTRRAEGKRPKLTASGWSEVLQDLFELRRLIPVVGLDACIEILCESLLCSEEDNLHLVKDIFNYRPADALFKTKSALLYVLSVHKVALVTLKSKEKAVSAACEFFLDSSKDLDDPNLEVAQKCLDLVSEESPLLQKYHDILSGLLMLRDFGVSILPIVLRNTTNFLPIVQKILQIDGNNYKNARKILRMIRLLRPDLEVKEAPILALIADEALKTKDFDYCLSICELMIERPSSEACKVCLHLVNTEDFADLTAKAKLSAFCVNYCEDDLIEDMIFQRLHLQEEQDLNIVTPLAAAAASSSTTTNASAASSEDNAMKDALSKLTKDNFIPDSTKVISSLFGKLSNVITQKAAGEENDEDELSLSEMQPHVKGQQLHKGQRISINAFYEDIYDSSHNVGLLHSSLDSYASTAHGSPLDKATLALISKHYRNFYQLGEDYAVEHSIEWVVLRDILAIILEEDTALGMTLMLTEMEHHPDFMADFINTTSSRPQIGLYAAALYCAIKSWPSSSSSRQRRQKIVDFPPGFLYCCVKSLSRHEGLLRGKSEQVLQKALSSVKSDDE